MVDYCLTNSDVQKVVVSELSRLGRSTLETLKTVELLSENKISLYVQNLSIETLDTNKEVSISSKLMITMLSEFAAMERTQISQRMKSGYRNYIQNGGTVGRTLGSKKSNDELFNDHKDIVKYLRSTKKYSLTEIAKLTGKNKRTVMKMNKLILEQK